MRKRSKKKYRKSLPSFYPSRSLRYVFHIYLTVYLRWRYKSQSKFAHFTDGRNENEKKTEKRLK